MISSGHRLSPAFRSLHREQGTTSGILLMVCYDPSLTGWYKPLYNPTKQGFFHCSSKFIIAMSFTSTYFFSNIFAIICTYSGPLVTKAAKNKQVTHGNSRYLGNCQAFQVEFFGSTAQAQKSTLPMCLEPCTTKVL